MRLRPIPTFDASSMRGIYYLAYLPTLLPSTRRLRLQTATLYAVLLQLQLRQKRETYRISKPPYLITSRGDHSWPPSPSPSLKTRGIMSRTSQSPFLFATDRVLASLLRTSLLSQPPNAQHKPTFGHRSTKRPDYTRPTLGRCGGCSCYRCRGPGVRVARASHRI